MSMRRRLLSASALLSVSACSLAPPLQMPEPPVPQSWPVGDTYLARNEAALPVVTYSDVFRDPRLQRLIETALVENRDLRTAYANLAAARAQVRVVRAGQFPEVGVNAGVSTSRNGASGTTVGAGETRTSYNLQGGVSAFELDLFGRLADATEAQRQRAFATEAVARTIRVALIAEIATAYATYAADRDLLSIAEATAASARESVRLTRLRLEGGVAPRTDLSQAQQVLASAEQAIAEQTGALAQDANLLRLLVGADVDGALLPAGLDEVEASYANLPPGLDSRILLRRPDVIEAEYLLRAANADIGVARAALFPNISLTGLLGLASTALGSLFTGDAFTFSAGASGGYSIFDAGGRRAGVAVSEAQRDAAIATYEGTIQTAFREIADALADQGSLAARQRAASANVEAAATTAHLTEARYRNGIDSFLDSLIAQRSLFTARQQLAAIRLAELTNRAALYRVLGGDSGNDIPGPNQAPSAEMR